MHSVIILLMSLASGWLKSWEHSCGRLLMCFFDVYFENSSKASYSGFWMGRINELFLYCVIDWCLWRVGGCLVSGLLGYRNYMVEIAVWLWLIYIIIGTQRACWLLLWVCDDRCLWKYIWAKYYLRSLKAAADLCFCKRFSWRFVLAKILVLLNRALNIPVIAYLSKRWFCENLLERLKTFFRSTVFSENCSMSA
jgi:hypothetical protein